MDLKEIKARCEAATKGTWKIDAQSPLDAYVEFIRACITDIPDLLAEVERRSKQRDYLSVALQEISNAWRLHGAVNWLTESMAAIADEALKKLDEEQSNEREAQS